MKRFVILLVVLGLLMAFPAGAAAKKPPGLPGPGGDDGPMAGTECVDAENTHLAYPVSEDFGLTVDGFDRRPHKHDSGVDTSLGKFSPL